MKNVPNIFSYSIKNLQFHLFGLFFLFLIVASTILFFMSRSYVTGDLLPEVEKQSLVIGQKILSPVQKALHLGIDLHHMRGVEDHFESAAKNNPAITFIYLCDDTQKTLYRYAAKDDPTTSPSKKIHIGKIPLQIKEKSIGFLHLGIDLAFYETTFFSWKMMILCIITLILSIELFTFIFRSHIHAPIDAIQELLKQCKKGDFSHEIIYFGRDEISRFNQTLGHMIKKVNNLYHGVKSKITIRTLLTESQNTPSQSIIENIEHQHTFSIPLQKKYLSNIFYTRLPLFFFFMAEYMLGPFFPLYSQSLYTPIFGLPQSMAITLPIVSFMFMYALSQPLSGLMTQFVKRHYIFIYGGLIYAIGTVGSAFTYNLIDFIVWRFFSGFGYGLFLIAWQAYLADYNHRYSPSDSFKNTVMYMGGFYAATVCGTATGALLVDVFGFSGTVFMSALLGIAATFLAHNHSKILKKALSLHNDSNFIKQSPLTIKEFFSIFMRFISPGRNLYILGFLVCIAIPSRLLMAGVFWHGLPLHLTSLHYSMPKIGGIMMLFGIGFYVMSFIIPHYVTRITDPLKLTLIGAIIASSSVFFLYGANDRTLFYIFFTLIMGFGSGLSLTAQISIPGSLYYREKTTSHFEAMTIRFYRFFELSGLFLGPLLMGFMMMFMSIKTAIILVACSNILLTLAYYIIVNLRIVITDRKKATL